MLHVCTIVLYHRPFITFVIRLLDCLTGGVGMMHEVWLRSLWFKSVVQFAQEIDNWQLIRLHINIIFFDITYIFSGFCQG